jgi:hypothetical protein
LVEHLASLSLTLTASASSFYDQLKADNALAKGTDKFFYSDNVPGSWWAVDFGINFILEGYQMPFTPYCDDPHC